MDKLMENLDTEVNYLLQKAGKEVFVRILYPELKENRYVSVEDIARKYPKFASFTSDSQKTRLSKANKIFALGKLKEAFQIILLSRKVKKEILQEAREILKQL